MADLIYTSFKRRIGDGTFDLDGDTLKCALLAATHTPNAAHAVLAEVSGDEVSGTGYTAGGVILTGVTWGNSGASAVLDAADPQWTDATITARYAVIYKSGTANGLVNPLVCLLDFSAEKGVTGGTFVVKFNASGIVVLN